MAIPKGHKENLETIIRAAKSGNLAVMECEEKETRKVCNVLVAVNFDGKDYEFVPFAKLFDGNPYEMLNPPAPGGGFAS